MNYLQIEETNISCGPGVRVVLWVSGCDFHCKGCQNPESWSFEAGKPFDEQAFQILIDALSHDYIRGLTFCGGEPMHPRNAFEVKDIARRVKEIFPNKDIWCYTGYSYEDVSIFMEDMDVVIDGLYKEELRDVTLAWRGSSNQRVIDVKESIKQNEVRSLL